MINTDSYYKKKDIRKYQIRLITFTVRNLAGTRMDLLG